MGRAEFLKLGPVALLAGLIRPGEKAEPVDDAWMDPEEVREMERENPVEVQIFVDPLRSNDPAFQRAVAEVVERDARLVDAAALDLSP